MKNVVTESGNGMEMAEPFTFVALPESRAIHMQCMPQTNPPTNVAYWLGASVRQEVDRLVPELREAAVRRNGLNKSCILFVCNVFL